MACARRDERSVRRRGRRGRWDRSGFAYLAGLRLVEQFVDPSFDAAAVGSGVGVATLLITIAAVVAILAATTMVRHPAIAGLRSRATVVVVQTAHPGITGIEPARKRSFTTSDAYDAPIPAERDRLTSDEVSRSKVRADIARAAWDRCADVAAHVVRGSEPTPRRSRAPRFDEATAVARRQLRSRTHLSLAEFRRDHQAGLTTPHDVQWALESELHDVCSMAPLQVGDRCVSIEEIIGLDLFHGPDLSDRAEPQTALERVEGPTGPLGDDRLDDCAFRRRNSQRGQADRFRTSGSSMPRRWRDCDGI